MEILDPFECIDGTIGEHVIQIEAYTVHCYYSIIPDSENSVIGFGRGPVQCRDDHIHLFIYKRRLFLLRTDGGSSAEELIGNVPAHVPGTVLKRLRLIYQDFVLNRGGAVMMAPCSLQYHFYSHQIEWDTADVAMGSYTI